MSDKTPKIRVSVAAWAKWHWARDRGDIEVTLYGVPAANDPLYIDDFVMPPQEGERCTTETDDDALADFIIDNVERYESGDIGATGLGRLWAHTHPAMSATPSGVDERTFATTFGDKEWAVMLILSKSEPEDVYARLKVYRPQPVEVRVPVIVDWAGFASRGQEALTELAERMAGWPAEYEKNVRVAKPKSVVKWSESTSFPYKATSSEGVVRYHGFEFSEKEWAQFNSNDYVPRRKYSRRSHSHRNDSAWEGVDVAYSLDNGSMSTGRVMEDDGSGWLTIRDDQTGETMDIDEDEVTPVSELYENDDSLTVDDALEKLDARIDEVDGDSYWCP